MRKQVFFEKKIKKIPYLAKIKKLAKAYNLEVYLVGGFLRDIFLSFSLDKLDFDFALSKKVLRFAKDFSNLVKGRLVILDKVLRNVRVVCRKKGKILNYDFSKFRGKDFLEDVKKRDFTINTLAINIKNFPRIELLDYLQALEDIEKKILRCISEEAFLDDSLRIMRGFSLSALYNLKIEKNTQKLMKKYKKGLKRIASERVAEELFKILLQENSSKVFKFMDSLSILEEIFPEIRAMRNIGQGGYHHLDVWRHSIETLRCFESLYKRRLAKDKNIVSYLKEEVAQGRKKLQLIKFACLFHDVGKPKARKKKDKKTLFYGHEKIGRDLAENICKRLRLSTKEEEFIKSLIYFHLRPGYLADIKRPTPRAIYKYFRDTKEEAVSILLLSLSDWRATRGPLTDPQRRRKHERVIFSLIEEYFRKKQEKPLKKLVNGYDIMRKFRVPSSPIVGKILRKIEESQALGKIATKKQALKLASKIYENNF